MSKSKSRTSKVVTRALAMVLSLAMVVTSLAVTGTTSDAKKKGKVTKVKVTSPVTNGGKLVLKKGQSKRIKVKVTTSKKGVSKKVTYKTSNKKVAKVVKKKGKYYVKAVGKKGSAKITITSKANKKKKATLKVTVGKPVKKVSVSGLTYTTSEYSALTRKTKKTNKKAKYSKSTGIVLETGNVNGQTDITTTYTCKINVKFSPKKPSYKKIKWSVKNSKVAYVTPTGIVTGRKAGTTTIIGKTKDGTNKQVKVKVTIKKSVAGPTATPLYETETRQATMIEDFEDYDVGEKWERQTKAKEYVNANCGDMTVVQDPENPSNKVLRIRYNGNTQAYDFAPVFSLNLKTKTLENYSAVRMKSRVVANASDCTYKTAYCYFAKRKTITPDYYFATSTKLADLEKKAKDKASALYGMTSDELKELLKFAEEKPMAEGSKTEYTAKDGLSAGKKYMNKYFPMYYSKYTTTDKNDVSAGFKGSETGKVGFQSNKLEFNLARIKEADKDLLGQKQLDMVIGSTYSGKYKNGEYVTLYIDDIEFLAGDIPLTKLDLQPEYTTTIAEKLYVKISPVLTPENSTFSEMTWKSSNPAVATVDAYGKVTGVKAGQAVITATCVKDPKFTKSVTITVVAPTPAAADMELDITKFTPKKPEGDNVKLTDEQAAHGSDVQATKAAKGINLPFTKGNQSVIIKLDSPVDFTKYKGVSITGLSDYQIALEFYDDKFDTRFGEASDNEYGEAFTKYNWWDRYQWSTYPFFEGSNIGREEDGTPTGNIGVETIFYSWDGSNGNDGTIRGSMQKVQYIVLKSNQFKEGGSCNVQSIKLLKDTPTKKYENP